MDDTKDISEQLEKLTKALEASKNLYQSPALKVEDQIETCKKYLTPKGLAALGLPRAKHLLHGTKDVATHRCVYYGVRVLSSQIERGVQKMAEIMNDLAEKGLIHSILSMPSSLDLVRLPGEEQTSAVFFYPLVPVAYADELDKARPKFYLREGEVGETIDDAGHYKKTLPAGRFIAITRLTNNFIFDQNLDEHYDVNGSLFNIVQEHLKLLPKGTKFLGAKKCAISDLAVPYELYFENLLLPDVSEIDLEYVRSVAVVDDKLEQFNLVLGIRYFDKAGKLRYPNR